MKKIFLLAGFVGCCVLLLSGFVLIVDFGDFANFLGSESKKIVEGKEDRFIGTWNIENEEEQLAFHSSGTVSGYMDGKYEIYEERLFINMSFDNELISYEYNLYFSDNNNEVIISDVNTGKGLVLHKI